MEKVSRLALLLGFLLTLTFLSGHVSHQHDGRRASEAKKDFGPALTELRAVLSLIKNRYELDKRQGSQFFRTANNIDPGTWNLLKLNFAHKMVTEGASFKMVFGGSSVTAGHDNYFNQSYPMIFEARMSKVFALLGVQLKVRNVAQGANGCIPYTFCYESMGGLDPDFLGWEQSYNCGRDNGVFELMARLAAWSRNPAVVYYSASGAWSPTTCPPSADAVPYCAESWSPAAAGLPAWSATVSEVEVEKEALFRYHLRGASVGRFVGSFRGDYPSAGLHGFNVWEKSEECVLTAADGRNSTCNGIDAVEGCAMRFMTREASLFGQPSGKGAAWHPPRAFHMLRGEALSWLYGLVLLEAIFSVQQDLLTGASLHSLRGVYGDKLKALKGTGVPHPKQCKGYRCERPPVCHTDYLPHYFQEDAKDEQVLLEDRRLSAAQLHGNMTLQEVVLGAGGWTYDAAALGAWSLEFGYLDAKPAYTSKGPEQGHLHVLVDMRASAADYAWICGIPKEDGVLLSVELDAPSDALAAYALPAANGTVGVPCDGRCYIPWENFRRVPGSDCEEIGGLPGGRHVLSLQAAAGNKHPISLTHLILFP